MGLSSRDEIANLVSHYAEVVDAGDFERIGRLFANASVECFVDHVSNGGRSSGVQDVMPLYRASVSIYHGSPRTQHSIADMIVNIADDDMSARMRSQFTVQQSQPDFPLQIIAAGRYHNVFRREFGI